MMNNVIELKPKDDGTGYILNDRAVEGVYVNNIAAKVDYDNVYLGTKGEDGIDDALLTNKKDLNQFCLMWLLMFNPEVIKEG
jgi:hypothetical protein